jgi:hypothetical protein
MKIKHLFFIGLFVFVLTTTSLPHKPVATSWVYSFVVWDGYIYVISDEYVTEIDKKIGHVTKYSDMAQYSGNFSNTYERGTKYYSIKNMSTDEAIAIQEGDGKYRKAVREGEYTFKEEFPFKGETFDFSNWVISVLLLLLIIMIVISFKKKMKR